MFSYLSQNILLQHMPQSFASVPKWTRFIKYFFTHTNRSDSCKSSEHCYLYTAKALKMLPIVISHFTIFEKQAKCIHKECKKSVKNLTLNTIHQFS